MSGERSYPILPCAALEDVLGFYEALGFEVTYRQQRPNPYAVVAWNDLRLHFAAIDGFDPTTSYGSVIVTVTDADAVYESFASGLQSTCGKVPRTGIPRVLRPRRKHGTAAGFSVVDPGGNWIRVYRRGDVEDREGDDAQLTGLALAIAKAARLGDAKGDHATAIRVLDVGLRRHEDAPEALKTEAREYRQELIDRDEPQQQH